MGYFQPYAPPRGAGVRFSSSGRGSEPGGTCTRMALRRRWASAPPRAESCIGKRGRQDVNGVVGHHSRRRAAPSDGGLGFGFFPFLYPSGDLLVSCCLFSTLQWCSVAGSHVAWLWVAPLGFRGPTSSGRAHCSGLCSGSGRAAVQPYFLQKSQLCLSRRCQGGLASKSRLEMTVSAPLALRGFFSLPPISCFNLCC